MQYRGNISSGCSFNYEANALELLENLRAECIYYKQMIYRISQPNSSFVSRELIYCYVTINELLHEIFATTSILKHYEVILLTLSKCITFIYL